MQLENYIINGDNRTKTAACSLMSMPRTTGDRGIPQVAIIDASEACEHLLPVTYLI